MTILWSLLVAARLALPVGAADFNEAPRRIILPGQEVRSSCASCALILPGQVALAPTVIPGNIPALAGEPISAISDGRQVSPMIVTPQSAAREPELNEARAAIGASVAQALPSLKDSVRLGEWRGPGTSLDSPCCGDAAPKLGLLLRNMGYGVNVVEAEMHYYLLHALAGGQLIIDPTIRQFFGGARAPPSVPTVFVGSVGQLHALFESHAAAKTTRYDMQRIYFKQAEIRDARMLELQQALGQRPRRVDLGPLSLFLQKLGQN